MAARNQDKHILTMYLKWVRESDMPQLLLSNTIALIALGLVHFSLFFSTTLPRSIYSSEDFSLSSLVFAFTLSLLSTSIIYRTSCSLLFVFSYRAHTQIRNTISFAPISAPHVLFRHDHSAVAPCLLVSLFSLFP
jgi:hypothetical protein